MYETNLLDVANIYSLLPCIIKILFLITYLTLKMLYMVGDTHNLAIFTIEESHQRV